MIPKGSFIEVEDNFTFHYYDEGDGDVVVFLHGSGTGASGHTNFKNNFKALREAGFRVILPDLPGYGFSSKPENEIYSLDYFNSKILQLLNALKIDSFSLIDGGCILPENILEFSLVSRRVEQKIFDNRILRRQLDL